ncbi:hypothetical protein [Canibacter zhoujuaniae]|uniref:hypothetical protein n=1 Tax=Canibacter zhoujuaniae TaxID=2708343 RepID=UPI001420E590|nr:hypothetical protein [Canibacter zhoujuaniae]
MTHITPKFKIKSPSPDTQIRNLGSELRDLADTVESALLEFDYSGQEPNRLVQRVRAIEEADNKSRGAYRSGTLEDRDAWKDAQPGAYWQDSAADGKLYRRTQRNTWTQAAGVHSEPGGSWAISTAVGAGRTVTVTLPCVLAANESLIITTSAQGSGFGYVGLHDIRRTATNTIVTVRHVQFFAATQNGFSFVWQITTI